MKFGKLSLAAIVVLSMVTSVKADSLADAFGGGKVSGELRAFYFDADKDSSPSEDTRLFAVGGKLAYETASFYGFNAGVAFYTTNDLGTYDPSSDTDGGEMFFDSNGDSFSVLGQSYLQYTIDNTMAKVGRQQFDTPLIGSDDVRIVPNLFEAYLVTNTDIPDTTLIAAHLTKMMGPVDSKAAGEDFVSMSDAAGADGFIDNNGVTTVGAIYKGLHGTTLQAWYYMAHDLLDAYYLDATYEGEVSELAYTFGAQYWNFDSDSEMDSAVGSKYSEYYVWGVMGAATFGAFTGTLAYNNLVMDNGQNIHGTWGGYTEYAQADEFFMDSLDNNTKDIDVTKAAIDFDTGFVTLSVAYVMFDSEAADTDVDVLDLIAKWECYFVKGLEWAALYENQDYDAANSDNRIIKLRALYVF